MDLGRIRKALLNPEIYPERPARIAIAETHISLVFLTGHYAYKVKKAVNFGFLDFSTLEKRGYFCRREVALNRRLAPEVYLGVAEITKTDGTLALDEPGSVVEYAVKMVQIPDDRMMDRCLARGAVDRGMIEKVAERLVAFYASAETNRAISAFGLPNRIRQDTDENFAQTARYVGSTISAAQYRSIREATNRFYQKNDRLFAERAEEGRIRDCHGDLRLEHVALGEKILIIDCIEFNERFRYTDVASDLAFLAMDLDYQDRPDLSRYLVETYINRSGDQGLAAMLPFYKSYRAYVRGKVESFRLDDPDLSTAEEEAARSRARKYFGLSQTYAERFFA